MSMRAFLDHTKCPLWCAEHIDYDSSAQGAPGFFRLGDMRLFGRTRNGFASPLCSQELQNLEESVSRTGNRIKLPFDPTALIDNLRFERYVGVGNSESRSVTDNKSLSRHIYYSLRPLFPVPVRRILQRIALKDWATIPFPSWPLDTTVEDLVSWLWRRILEVSGESEIPFIWFWPKSFQSCAIMTHDVETSAGQAFCRTMLDIERQFGIRSAFELVPEVRYTVSAQVLEEIRQAGSEVCVHGLNHDGRLFSSEEEFRRRAKLINQYAAKWGAKGFRSPVMYRNQNWYDAFEISYDMSLPNVAHLDPQRGGCCTIFPFFSGNMLVLPLTTVQDYSLYHILGSDPMTMWREQMAAVTAKNGLVSFIIHPDYTIARDKQMLYRELLGLLKDYGDNNRTWLALPGEVDTWWRQRSKMSLVKQDGKWLVHGAGSDRAVVAYARLDGKNVTYVLPEPAAEMAAALK